MTIKKEVGSPRGKVASHRRSRELWLRRCCGIMPGPGCGNPNKIQGVRV